MNDMVAMGLLTVTGRLNSNGNPIFIKTSKAKAMGGDALEAALARRGLASSVEVLAEEADERKKS
jgi:hypothetical protein